MGLSKKRECNELINKWEMTFQVSDDKDCNFPEFNSITNVGIEEFPKFTGD